MELDKQTRAGMLFAIAAYSMWGFVPIYFKALQVIPAGEVLMHRVIWSTVVLMILVVGLQQISKVSTALKSKKAVLTLLVAGLLLAANWLLFIWAVNNNYLLEASLGYYINPLLNVFLGRLFLGERLRVLQKVAVGIAALGVLVLVVNYGSLPWVALSLACSFGVYGLLRKQVNVDSLPGLLIETLMMLPAAIVYWIWFAQVSNDLSVNSSHLNLLILCAGIVTVAPLLCFTAAARRIKYSTLGFFQYIGPTIMFVLAAWLYNEPLSEARLITFLFVWSALALFTYDSIRTYRKQSKTDVLRPE